MKFQNKILAANFLCLFFWNVSFGNYDLVQFPEEYLCQMWGDEPDFVDEVDKIGDNGWKCIVDPKADKKGCKPKRLVCNNFTNCLDATDENRGCYIDKKSSDDNCYTWHFDVYQKYCLKYNPHNERCYNVDLEEFKPSESECIESSSFSYCQKLDKRWKDVIEYDLANEISDSYDWTSGCYHCWSGESIPKEWVCDGQKNCHDGSDESPDKGCKAIRDNGECTQHLNKKEENKTCIGDEFGSGFCDFYSNSIGTCLNCSSFWIENCTEANFKTAKGKQQCDYKCNGTLKTYQKKACHLPNILKSLIDDYSEEGTAFAEVIGLRASSMGSDLASECGEIIVIDVDNCPEAIDYRKNELRIKPTERYRKECAWILLSKHGSQISVDLPESYAANTLTFCDGPVTDNDKPCNLSGSIQVRSSNNTMSVRYRSEAQHDGKEIIIPYKSTDATDCKLDVLCYTKQNATWGGKTCGKVRPQCYTRNVGVLIGVVVLIIAGIFVVIFGFEPNYNDIYDKMMCQSCKDLVDTCEDVPLAKHTIKNFKMKWIYPVQSLPCFYLLHFYLHCRSAKRSGTKSNEHEPQLRRKNTSVNEIKGDPSEKHLASQCSHSSEKVIAVDINDDPEDQATGSTLPDNANDRLLTLNEHNSLDALKVKGELKYCESMTSKNGRFKVVMHASCFNGFKIYRNRIRGYEDYENLWAVDNNEELQSSNWQLPYRVKLGKHSIKIKVIGGQKKQISNDENPIIKIDMYHSLINEKITHIKMGDDGYIEFYSDKPRKIPRKKELNDYTMLVIGKVGAGKSTLCNILSGRKHDADDFETSNSIKSKTKAVEIKRVWFLKEELNPFVLIDTPGLGDPEILNQDEQMQKMNAEIGNLSHINLFVVCVDGGTNYRADSLFVKMMRDFKETFKFKMEGNEIVEDASIFWSRCVIAFTKVRTINCPKCDFKFPLKPEAERVQEYRQLLREQFKCDYEGNSHQAKSFDNHITKMQFINTDAGEHVLKQLYEKLIDPAAPKILAESMKKYAEQKRLSQEKTGSDFAYASNEGGLGELKIDVVEHEHVPISDGDIISSDEDSDLSLDQISHERNDGSSNNWKFKVSNISAVLDRSLGNIKTMFRNKQSDEFPGTELDDLKADVNEQDPLVGKDSSISTSVVDHLSQQHITVRREGDTKHLPEDVKACLGTYKYHSFDEEGNPIYYSNINGNNMSICKNKKSIWRIGQWSDKTGDICNVHSKDATSPQQCQQNQWQYYDTKEKAFKIDSLLCVEEESKDALLLEDLENVGLSQSYAVLKKEDVTKSTLWTLSQDDLEKIGVSLMQRKKYLQERNRHEEETIKKDYKGLMNFVISSKGPAKEFQDECLGEYDYHSVSNGRPCFKNKETERFLHWNPKSVWLVSEKEDLGKIGGYLYNNNNNPGILPENCPSSGWKVAKRKDVWVKDETVKLLPLKW